MEKQHATSLTREQRGWLWGLVVGALLVVLPIGYLAVRGLHNERRLSHEAARACAQVTDQRMMASARRRVFELQYVFSVANTRYTHSDETGRSGLWADVPQREWEQAQGGECIEVIYLPDDPAVNRPARATLVNDPVGNKVAALLLCALTLGLCGAGVVGTLRVARAELHGFELVGPDEWILRSVRGERRVPTSSIKRAVLIMLPPARAHPPWRFDTDVLKLKLDGGEEVLIEAPPGPITSAATSALEATGDLSWRGRRRRRR
ncbi:MAG: DUF3592 domain-containing protein [Sandaracinaceae bacterium]|nr:DUF3592 domain-containing protein [Myxococcales bacterium]MCB9660905.1 DUF3592 domain-containing protein [Sandaracinaceae bacterium]